MNSKKNNHLPPVEEGDYYMEEGLFVFTAQYHLKRGYCCQSGCRHCPYGFKKTNRQAHESKRNT